MSSFVDSLFFVVRIAQREDHHRQYGLSLATVASGPGDGLGALIIDHGCNVLRCQFQVRGQLGQSLLDRMRGEHRSERYLAARLQGAPQIGRQARLVDVALLTQGIGDDCGVGLFDHHCAQIGLARGV